MIETSTVALSQASAIEKPQKKEVAATAIKRNIIYNSFFIKTLVNTFISINVLVLAYILFKHFVPTTSLDLFGTMTEEPLLMFVLLFLSESFFGLLPPDIFIMWTLECGDCIMYLTIIAFLSYFGGMISFYVGKLIRRYPVVKLYLRKKMIKHHERINKYGGAVVVLAALTPLPFSPISVLAGSLNYPFKKYVLFASTRVIRFFIYAAIFYLVG